MSRDKPDERDPHHTAYRTLQGALRGHESDEPIYFAYKASLRIHGEGVPLDELTARLGVTPTTARRAGERRRPTSVAYRDDAWQYSPPLPEEAPLAEHIDALWRVVEPHVEYLRLLKQRFRVDVFCGYRSNCDHAGVEVPASSLALFTALDVPFGLSIIVLTDD